MREADSFFCEHCEKETVFRRNARERPGYNTLLLLSGGLWFFIWPLVNRFFMEDELWQCSKCHAFLIEELTKTPESKEPSAKSPRSSGTNLVLRKKRIEAATLAGAILFVGMALLTTAWLWIS